NIYTIRLVLSRGLSVSNRVGILVGVIGVTVITVIIAIATACICKNRLKEHCLTKRTSRTSGNKDASTPDGSYAICIIDSSQSRNANQYQTLVDLDGRDYSILSACNAQRDNTTSAKISASGQTDVSTTNPEYVNLQLFTN
ncbi:hypothetical protein DPMN_142695, partial [Dreissena polymorpha]